MKKRSKLDLTAGIAQGKRQAAGFDPVDLVDPVSPSAGSATSSPGWQHAEKLASSRARTRRQSRASKPKQSSRAVIIKTVAVLAVAALTLYALKRRFL